jgi:alpha-glucoside transport system permease protein
MTIKIANAVIAVVAGVGGILALYLVMNLLVERLPQRWGDRLRPYAFVGPALLVVGLFLVYPLVRSVILSFANDDTTAWVGLQNYVDLFGAAEFRETLVNNLLWIIVVPLLAVIAGLAVAVLADRLTPRAENVSKSVIFLPMAISFVGAATIWGFIYTSRPPGQPQIGILNAIGDALGFDPVAWLQLSDWNTNDFLLMVIMVWLQAGFAMVLLSAAIKNVPEETVEAARIDGAGEVAIFFRIVVPQIWATVTVVFVTVLILVMKVFDIVYVMTGGAFGTNVIGVRFFEELFEFGNDGRAAAIVVILTIAVIPVMVYQVRRFRIEENAR